MIIKILYLSLKIICQRQHYLTAKNHGCVKDVIDLIHRQKQVNNVYQDVDMLWEIIFYKLLDGCVQNVKIEIQLNYLVHINVINVVIN
jgi:hypothetical protein